MATQQKMRVKIKGYDHEIVDMSAQKIVDMIKRYGVRVSGPVPLPTKKEVITILRSVHKHKDSREQFEMRTHKRLIDIIRPTEEAVKALSSLELPAGIDIELISRC